MHQHSSLAHALWRHLHNWDHLIFLIVESVHGETVNKIAMRVQNMLGQSIPDLIVDIAALVDNLVVVDLVDHGCFVVESELEWFVGHCVSFHVYFADDSRFDGCGPLFM